jgi:hypothetical protein
MLSQLPAFPPSMNEKNEGCSFFWDERREGKCFEGHLSVKVRKMGDWT